MPLSEPLVTVTIPCEACDGTGTRPPEDLPGGARVVTGSGANPQCRECGGAGAVMQNYTLPGFAQLTAPFLP